MRYYGVGLSMGEVSRVKREREEYDFLFGYIYIMANGGIFKM